MQNLRKRGMPAAALLFGFVVCLGLVAIVRTPAPVSTGALSLKRYDGLRPVPDNLRVKLILDRETYLLGESISVRIEVTNVGQSPAPYESGATYPLLHLNDAFRMSATKLKLFSRTSAPTWPIPPAIRGATHVGKLFPGQVESKTLIVTRYVRFLEPGQYLLRVDNIDRFAEVLYASGETTLTLNQPTPEEALGVFERMKRERRLADQRTNPDLFPHPADFKALHQPVYFPILKARAEQFDRDAFSALERMQSRAANDVLVSALSRALDVDDWRTARAAYRQIQPTLPNPIWFSSEQDWYFAPNRDVVRRAWRKEYAPALTRLARRLLQEVRSARQHPELAAPERNDNPDPDSWFDRYSSDDPESLLADVDYIDRCLGHQDDLTDRTDAFQKRRERQIP